MIGELNGEIMWTSLVSFKYWKHIGAAAGVIAILMAVNFQGRTAMDTKWKLRQAEQVEQSLKDRIEDQRVLHEADLSKQLAEAARTAKLEERDRLAKERLEFYEEQIDTLKETNRNANNALIKAQATRPDGNDLLAGGVSDILNDYVDRIQSRRRTSGDLRNEDRLEVQEDSRTTE